MDSHYTTQEEFLKLYHSLKPLRTIINTLDAKKHLAVCLQKDYQYAYELLSTSGAVPDFYILDAEHDTAKAMGTSLKSPQRKGLIVAPHASPWTGYLPAATILAQRGIKEYDILSGFDKNTPWIHEGHLEQDYISKHIDTLTILYNQLVDKSSKIVFLRELKARVMKDIGYIDIDPCEQYIHKAVPVYRGDVVIDGGLGIDLVPTRHFIASMGTQGRLLAFEPVPQFYNAAQKELEHFKNVEVFNCGLYDTATTLSFCDEWGESSHVDKNGNTTISVVPLDTILQERQLRCDFIKLDIEGAEPEALRGMEQSICRYKPNLAICVYHRPREQVVSIFKWLHELGLGYKFYMISHHAYYSETVLYATVSTERR